ITDLKKANNYVISNEKLMKVPLEFFDSTKKEAEKLTDPASKKAALDQIKVRAVKYRKYIDGEIKGFKAFLEKENDIIREFDAQELAQQAALSGGMSIPDEYKPQMSTDPSMLMSMDPEVKKNAEMAIEEYKKLIAYLEKVAKAIAKYES
ncbi:hypothetical protein HN709_04295, partial [Candidatus Peregrinibacteria bacterium]|nr:hypothetical protein [Candidatus Peregrinibacteria bacterium]